MLADREWAVTDLTAAIHIFVFPLRSPVDDYTLSLGADCGVYTSGQSVSLLNQATGSCTTRYIGGFTTMSVPTSCMPTPQPKYVGFRVSAAYSLKNAHESAFKDTEIIPKNCFTLTSAVTPVQTFQPLDDVELGAIPPPNMFMYGVTLTRDSTETLHRARFDVRTVLTNVITSATVDVVVSLSANTTTCPVSPKSSFINTAFHAGTANCTLTSVTTTLLTVTCINGPFYPPYPFVFGFSHLQLDPTKLATFDSPTYHASNCIVVDIAYGTSTASGVSLGPVGAPPPLQAVVDRTRATDLYSLAPFHLQVMFFDLFWFAGVPNFDFVLPTGGDYTYYSYPMAISPAVAGFKTIGVPTSSLVVTVTTEATTSVSACSSTASCVLRIPLTREFAPGPANPMRSLTILSRAASDPAQIVTEVPIVVLPEALQPQLVPSPPLSILSALDTISGANERSMSMVILSTQSVLSSFGLNLILTLPTTGLSYSSAQYSVIVGTGTASAYASVGAAGIITIAYIAGMANTNVTVTLKQVTVSVPAERLAVVVELVGSRTTSATTTSYAQKLMNFGYGSAATAISTSFAYATKQLILSDKPAIVVLQSCTHSVGTARYTVTCDVAWPSINDVSASMALALATRDASPHVTPTDVSLESAQSLLPTVSSLCTPVTVGGNVPLDTCLAAATAAPTLRVLFSCSRLVAEQEIELRLLSGTILRAIAVIPALAAGPYFPRQLYGRRSLQAGSCVCGWPRSLLKSCSTTSSAFSDVVIVAHAGIHKASCIEPHILDAKRPI